VAVVGPAKFAAAQTTKAAPSFELKDGDRVVLLGSTFVERSQQHGHFEAALSSRYPGRLIQFRNLGWSGDNVFGESRAGFGPVEEGFQHLKDHVLALKPTVILLGYGGNEAFAGKAGLDHFLGGLDTLLKVLDETGAQIVFITPSPQEDLGRPLPEPTQHNQDLKLYRDAIVKLAGQRGNQVLDLYELLDPKRLDAGGPITDNGIHLTEYGYWLAAPQMERGLGLADREWQIVVDPQKGNISARGTQVSQAKFAPESIQFVAQDTLLPHPPVPSEAPQQRPSIDRRTLRVFDLPPGGYALKIDGEQVASADARGWARGVEIAAGPEFQQAEKLRGEIVAKNELYFHRWRPQNITYLTGFRKHEQGNNAVEIPQFDPLVEARENEIRTLSQPVPHTYQIVKEAGE
jgi:hypothetical protein